MFKRIIIFLIIISSQNYVYALDILYNVRAPYIQETQAKISGLVATPLLKALNKTDIQYKLVKRPNKRHLYAIKNNTRQVCALGWFKNAEREKFGQYTQPLYQDKPLGILVGQHANIASQMTLSELSLSSHKILMKTSFSYGKLVDSAINNGKLVKRIVKSSTDKMATLIAKKRADFMFISPEEASVILKNNIYEDRLQFVEIKKMPPGNNRYLICSLSVPDNIINTINENL